ncbi:MAG: hypothetical protein BMS9Abin13_158 [Patescibacteria group bacterium]|nr:MAG: hypothetical protein BMS9Abin13_158 [Patescibacteria group bacterium]
MKKFIIIAIFIAVVILLGLFYRNFLLPEALQTVEESGKTIEIEMRAIKNEWRFDPDYFEVGAGDRVVINFYNEDDYDHGFALEAYGINKRLPPKEWVKLEFVAGRVGEFPFYCSVSCGSGVVDGVKRTHFDMVGKMMVR